VREALQRLEAQGLITMRKNQILVNALSEAEMHEIFAIRGELEAFAIRIGADRIRDTALIGDLESLIETMELHVENPEEWRAANEQFHLSIYRMAGMPRLDSIIDALWTAVEPYLRRYVYAAVPFPTAQTQHRAILDHLRTGDGDAAADVLRQHLRDTEKMLATGMRADTA
jgi:DNA-binding GntR family transcriptional regulator